MKKSRILLFAVAMLSLWACDDILETDISDKQVFLLAPGDSVLIKQDKVTFLWEPVAGATGYILQVVQPSFEETQTVVLDTFVVEPRFTYNLPAGDYSWGVSAVNSAYATYFYTRFFTVDSTVVTSVQGISLISPANKLVSKDSVINFSWDKVPDVASYKLVIDGAWKFSAQTADTGLKLVIPAKAFDDTLRWQVLGFTSTEQQKYHSAKRWLFIDTPPAAVKLLTPEAGGTSSLTALPGPP